MAAAATCEATHAVAHAETEATPPTCEAGSVVAPNEAEAARPSVLGPILRAVVKASTAFTPLKSAADDLLKMIDIVEVQHCLPLKHPDI